MVAHQFLALLVRVRVLAGQHKKDAFQRLFLFINGVNGEIHLYICSTNIKRLMA